LKVDQITASASLVGLSLMKKLVNTPKIVKLDNQDQVTDFYLNMTSSLLSDPLKGKTPLKTLNEFVVPLVQGLIGSPSDISKSESKAAPVFLSLTGNVDQLMESLNE
jgi:hypothetical protein